MSVAIRALTVEDWRALRELRLHALRTDPGVFFSTYDAEVLWPDSRWIALAGGDDTRQLFGLVDDGRLVGISGVFVDRDEPSGEAVVLGMSYILPKYRRRGFASRFYEARLAWVRAAARFRRVKVGHRRSNEASRRAIERFGFRWTADEPRRWPDGGDEDYVAYELLLREPGAE
jgi:RimJ/RimL family protein N-acetyltransferase